MQEKKAEKQIAIWLLIGVAMIIGQVLLGGVTRLTGSGLSIAEWKPILGAVPPLNEKDWNAAFELYKQKASGQYYLLNSDFTLGDFKAIYFWEWMHRLWGRLMGVVFVIGFVYFLSRNMFKKSMITPFVILFILGGLQGVIGWVMVMSGLNENDTHVSHIRLAIHFIAALILLCYVLWFALQLLIPEHRRVDNPRLHRFTLILIALLGLQLVYGAFMAGLKAAPAAPTWPTINGGWTVDDPAHFGNNTYTGIRQLTDHPLMIHLIHRTIAYLLFFGIVAWFFQVYASASRQGQRLLSRAAFWPLLLVTLQVLLGIFTVLLAPRMTGSRFGIFELLAESHQLVAMFLLMSLVTSFYILRRR